MKISYNWLCEILPGLEKITAIELADKLSLSGLEVDSVTDLSAKFKGIVVGKVVSKEKHPDADKLSLCQVSTGKEQFQVVCGAANVAKDKLFPFATLGTTMPAGLVIKTIKLRGVESSGMLCSAKELELSEEAEGLLELSHELVVGENIAAALGLNDVIIDIDITPNRGDALSHWGVACDVAALLGLRVDFTPVAPKSIDYKSVKPSIESDLKVSHRDEKACGRFTASFISGVQISSSPDWLKYRLESLDVRSINNVVDATNYVMLLTGHPVHAYDARDIRGNEIVIESLSKDEKFTTLDSQEHQLLAADLIIGDAKGPVGLAGIMGGENSEIKEDTKEVILEVAFFNPDNIRATARRLGLQTESSYRFERFVNPDTTLKAHEVLRDLVVHLAGGKVSKIQDSYPKPYKSQQITLAAQEIVRILGIAVPSDKVTSILQGLNCQVKESKEGFTVIPPIARSDLTRPIDLIEEIARIYGLDQIPAEMPAIAVRTSEENPVVAAEKAAKDFLVGRGFRETVHYSFGDRDFFAKVLGQKGDDWIELQNPIASDMAIMKPSLLPDLLKCYLKNRLLSDSGVRLFELRNVYHKAKGDAVIQTPMLTGLYQGNPFGRNRFGMTRDEDFFDGKGLLSQLFDSFKVDLKQSRFEKWPYHPGQALGFYNDDVLIASIGALHPQLLQQLKIKDRLYSFEVDFEALCQASKQDLNFEAVSSLPSVYRDLALVLPDEVSYEQIMQAIKVSQPKHLKEICLFDLFTGGSLPEGKKSLAFSIRYEPSGESLTDELVNEEHFGLVEKLKKSLGAELR
jgi:phenylalanyl-tRNA synthetase beta chain